MDGEILRRCREAGIDGPRLKACLDGKDNWGGMVHAFEYLAVLGIVCDALLKEQ